MLTPEEILNTIPDHRDKTRAQIFQEHCYAYHNNYILLEYNQDGVLSLVAGCEKRTGKPLKSSNLQNLAELLVLPLDEKEWGDSEEKDPTTQFVVRTV